MNSFHRVSDGRTPAATRRSFLGLMAIAAAAPVLAGCSGTATSGGAPGAAGTPGSATGVLPNYVPVTYVQPDILGVDGSTPGFTKWPSELVQAVSTVPGKGGRFTAMTPTYGTVLPGLSDSQYLQQVNEKLGATFDFQFTDNGAYIDKLQAVFASPKDVPDFVTISVANIPPRFDQALPGLFTDLGPYLSGDKVEKYPNLANIPTAAWSSTVFDGKLYAMPYPSDTISSAIYYRKDLLDGLGITDLPTTAPEFLELTKRITDPGAGRWAGNDLLNASHIIHAVPPKWKVEDGELVHRYESAEYRDSLEFTASLFEAGVIHPDAVAGNSAQDKQRFQSGDVLISYDGYSGWVGSYIATFPTNPDYDQQPLPWLSADGSKPVVFRGAPSNLMTFIKKTDDPERMEEILELLNFIASPFGTQEQVLLQNGIEGLHWNPDPSTGVPVKTDLGRKEVGSTYQWLVRPPITQFTVQYPELVTQYCEFMADTMQYAVEPTFYGKQILEPVRYASLSQPFSDLEKDIARGRRSISDLDTAVETWRSQGGDQLREFYAGYLEN